MNILFRLWILTGENVCVNMDSEMLNKKGNDE